MLTLAAMLSIAADAWAGYSNLVIFGDSLSDVGNVYSQSFGFAPSSPPYYQGRYSNGPLWVEDLALDQGLPVPTRSRSGGTDWAYAGTKTGSGSTNYVLFFNFPNVGTQINNYLNGRTPSASELFVVWGGGNDFIDGQTNVSVPVNNIVSHITTLANAGAKDFLIPNLPPLGQTPRFRGTANQTTMDSRSASFNTMLASSLMSLETSLSINIYQLDVGGLFADLLANPSEHGLSNVTGTALVNSTSVANPDDYLFWDDIHPTRIGHSLLATAASDLLDTHTWTATQPSATWTASASWDSGGTPQARWITNVINPSTGARTAVVSSSSSVRRITISGSSNQMELRVGSGGNLTVSEAIRVQPRGRLTLAGGSVRANALDVVGGAVAFALASSHGSAPLTIDGPANLDGTLAISLANGFVALPGSSYDLMSYTSHSGSLSILNETPYAGLSFLANYSASTLSILASAMPGDATLDGAVDVADLKLLAMHWQASADWLGGDFDGNGLVDQMDLGLLAVHWDVSGSQSLTAALTSLSLPTAAVPEPNVAVLSLLSLGLFRRRR
jgi:phospholipase/lecithinase/hemolysin